MKNVIPIIKPVGLTPLQALQQLRILQPELQSEKLAYAGRLDPMAEGVLLVLVGETCKERQTYQMLPKTYQVSILFGVSTDTYDALGKVTSVKKISLTEITDFLCSELPDIVGKYDQQYPPYSAVLVNGKPLFYWAREGKIHTIKIPSKTIQISSVTQDSKTTITSENLFYYSEKKIQTVQGDFRQKEILKIWKNSLSQKLIFPLVTLTIQSSQGAYMRSIAHTLGEKMGTGAIALHIKRTAVGSYSDKNALPLRRNK